jgi:hypothetical protein
MLATFFVLEQALRRGTAAKTLDVTPFDRGTTRAIGLAFLSCALSVMVAPLLTHLGLGEFGNPTTAWAGVAGMIFGISLRVWANQTLGSSYTRTLKTVQGSRLCRMGRIESYGIRGMPEYC